MKEVIIYTDGACSNNPGIGGWGAILMYGEHTREISGFAEETTNNRMELQAAIEALSLLKMPCKVSLHSDSAYLCNAFNNGWIWNWLKNGWKTAAKKAVENRELWESLLMFSKQHRITWIKVKGHADNPYNNRCDELARAAIKAQRSKLETEG